MEQTSIERICPQCDGSFGSDHKVCPDDGTRLREIHIRTSSDEEDPLLGKELDGRFIVEKILGEGGMGKVYLGKQLSVNRDVAIKVLQSKLAGDEKLVRRFFREAQVISQFSHPNIVRLVEFGQDLDHDVLYLAMEYIDGTELGDLIRGKRMAPALAMEIIIQACEGLSEAHSRDVVHRDLKPENLMLIARSDGRVQAKVVDFGIAHALQTNTRLTKTGSVFGTAYYMAPEQASGEGEIGPFTDVYALGCILFELLSGRVPFVGASSMHLVVAHLNQPPPSLEELLRSQGVKDFGDEIEALSSLILAMMAKEPDQRPDSVLAVRDELERIHDKFALPSVRVDPTASPAAMFGLWMSNLPSSDRSEAATVDAMGDTAAYGEAQKALAAMKDEEVGGGEISTEDIVEQQKGSDNSRLFKLALAALFALAAIGLILTMMVRPADRSEASQDALAQSAEPDEENDGAGIATSGAEADEADEDEDEEVTAVDEADEADEADEVEGAESGEDLAVAEEVAREESAETAPSEATGGPPAHAGSRRNERRSKGGPPTNRRRGREREEEAAPEDSNNDRPRQLQIFTVE